MRATWTGIIASLLVIYYGVVHAATNPWVLLNPHALILVIGGTAAVGLLTYSVGRLMSVFDFILFGFLFRLKKQETTVARELISLIDDHYRVYPTFINKGKKHPFLEEVQLLLENKGTSAETMKNTLMDRRNSIKRRYTEDAKILNNLAKYPPHLGLMGAASGMIEMMSNLGKAGTETIGASLAVALSATLWGVGLNNFVFLPLADNSMKAAEDEIYLRDIIIECGLMMKNRHPHREVVATCMNRLSLQDFSSVREEYDEMALLRVSPTKPDGKNQNVA